MGDKLSKNNGIGKICIWFFILFAVGFIFGYGISNRVSEKEEQPHEPWEEPDYFSDIVQEDCLICKTRKLYSNENNLGILFLNEGAVNHVGINRYDEHGKLIEKEDTYTQISMGPAYGENMGIRISTNRDRGYAKVDIDLGDNAVFDMDMVSEHCCEECIEQIMDEYFHVQPYDILVLNYCTDDLQLISSNLISFTMGDYYVSCEPRTNKGEDKITEVDLLIFFCPNRYGDI